MTIEHVQHIAFPADWEQAQATGSYTVSTRGRTLAQEGYIHCARPDQVAGVLQRFYADVTEPLLLLTIDPTLLTAEVIHEPPAPGIDETFPHVYGPIEIGAVIAVDTLAPAAAPRRQPGEPLTVSSRRLVEEANAVVTTIRVADAVALLDDPTVLFVDIRDPRELERDGQIPGAFRAPRGMLEFWVDPGSPYYKPVLDDGRRLVLYCGSAWRSALAAAVLTRMGREDVAHLEGGFSAWRAAGHPVDPAG